MDNKKPSSQLNYRRCKFMFRNSWDISISINKYREITGGPQAIVIHANPEHKAVQKFKVLLTLPARTCVHKLPSAVRVPPRSSTICTHNVQQNFTI